MNFRHMPELDWRFGYAFALAVIVGTTTGLLYWLKRKKWF
jgi:magnesium transporter